MGEHRRRITGMQTDAGGSASPLYPPSGVHAAAHSHQASCAGASWASARAGTLAVLGLRMSERSAGLPITAAMPPAASAQPAVLYIGSGSLGACSSGLTG